MADQIFTVPPNIYRFGGTRYYTNVARTLKGEISTDTDGIEGRKSLALIKAVYG
jgi:hypothetical protein